MAPLSVSTQTRLLKTLDDGTFVFAAVGDPEWTIGSVIFGGFALGCVLDAISQTQSNGIHPDPVCLTVQFILAMIPGPFEIHIRVLRKGKHHDHLHASVHQKDRLIFTAQTIYGNLEPDSRDPDPGPSLPKAYTPICPLRTHPAVSKPSAKYLQLNFFEHYEWAEDMTILNRNDQLASDGQLEDGISWEVWTQLHDKTLLTSCMIPFFFDLTKMPWDLLPREVKGTAVWWTPSLSISLEFKTKFPLEEAFAPHTMGVYGRKRHMKNGRWSDSVELWTAPSSIGVGEIRADWRDEMVCVAVGSQVALAVPEEKNYKRRSAALRSKL
ncbi:hypothetical protein FRB99_007659 [Tulasnella sp. 403]|nr:hypothetical protein FRB99_007659 [Tulasnella sp. 403]